MMPRLKGRGGIELDRLGDTEPKPLQ